ncbi:MAG TPA: hypothetical protein VHU86_07680 [Solirubrobacterales bacterium]|jgi:hypothetical protein|nr:hypothetical protein [Solirubrobacterales bacterium]
MRVISRHRHNHRGKAPRISISPEEIAADLHYPARVSAQRRRPVAASSRGGR